MSRLLLELDDDFFVVEGSISQKKKKKKVKKKHREISVEDISLDVIKEEPIVEQPETQQEDLAQSPPTDSGSITPPPRLRESITPPPSVDDSVFYSARAEFEPDEPEQEIEQEIELEPELPSDIEIVQETQQDGPYNFDEDHEKLRQYLLRVTSKIPMYNEVPTDAKLDFSAKGTKRFSKIIDSVLAHFKKRYANDANFASEYYVPEAVCLIWVEGKSEIRPFYKLSTLRIPPLEDITEISCLLIPKQHSRDFQKVYPEFQSSIHYNTTLDSDDEVQTIPDPEPVPDNHFIIGLKGSDNKRIEVLVSPETVIRKILDYYLSTKNITNTNVNKVKMIFDDEVLDLNATVADTELEEDFEIQIVLS